MFAADTEDNIEKERQGFLGTAELSVDQLPTASEQLQGNQFFTRLRAKFQANYDRVEGRFGSEMARALAEEELHSTLVASYELAEKLANKQIGARFRPGKDIMLNPEDVEAPMISTGHKDNKSFLIEYGSGHAFEDHYAWQRFVLSSEGVKVITQEGGREAAPLASLSAEQVLDTLAIAAYANAANDAYDTTVSHGEFV